jgi:hypothetical protein
MLLNFMEHGERNAVLMFGMLGIDRVDADQLLGIRHRKRTQHQCIDYTEDCRICANAQG